MVSFSDLFTYTLVIIAIITLVSNRKEKQPPRPEKTSDYFSLVILVFRTTVTVVRWCLFLLSTANGITITFAQSK